MMTGNFAKALEGKATERMSKNLKVPSSKAKELFRAMIEHGQRKQKGKTNR